MRRSEIGSATEGGIADHITRALCGKGSFHRVAAAPLADLVRLGTLVELDCGEVLIRQGEPPTPEIYVLVAGTLVVRSSFGFIARLDQPGTVVGEVAVLMVSERSADVVAESPVQVLALSSDLMTSADAAGVAAVLRQVMSDSLGSKLRDDWVRYEDIVKF